MMNPLIAKVHFLPLLAVQHHRFFPFRLNWSIQSLLALIAGLLILVRPKLLNFIVAIYLIVVGLIGVFRWA